MSEFLGEARVVIRPDTTAFRTQLVAQLATVTKGVTVPISVAPVVGGRGLAASATGFARLTEVQEEVRRSANQVTGVLGEQDKALKRNTASLLGAGTASAKLNAGLLGLRTAIGSSAVIGLGALSLAAIGVGQAFRGMLQVTAQFESQLNTFQAVTEATAEQMQAISDAALQLGQDVSLPATSAADAAEAMTELAKAGLTVEEAMVGARGTLELATAAQISNAEASIIAANALNSFGLAGDQAVRVADVLANASNAAQGSISDFGLALRQSSAVARQVGLSLEDTTAILSLFARNGLQGSDAGTSLRVALIRLVAPTKKAAAEIEKLGLDIRDVNGNVRADVFAQFGEATENLTPALRDASAALIFGQDAIRAVSIGAREGADGLRLMQFEIDQAGTASEVAAARTKGLGGSFSALVSTAETAGITLGELASPIVSGLVTGLTDLVAAADKGAQALKRLGEVDIPGIAGKLNEPLLPGGREIISESGIDVLKRFGLFADESAQRIKTLREEMDALQTARVQAESGGASGVADQLTKQINALRKEIAALEQSRTAIEVGVNTPLEKAISTLNKLRGQKIQIGADTTSLDKLIASLTKTAQEAGYATIKVNGLPDGITRVGTSSRDAAGGVDALARALAGLTLESARANDQLLKAQNEGASPQTQIGILQGQRQTQEDIIANLKKDGITAGEPSQIRAAREEINRIQGEIDGLQAGIEADAKAAASAAQARKDKIADAASKAAQAQEDATRAFINSFDPANQKILNQIAAAALTERLSDDIKFQQSLVASLRAQIQLIKDRIKRLKLQGDALAAAKAAIAAFTQRINGILLDIAKDQQSAQQRTRDILNQKLDFRIQIAQAQDNVAAEIRARKNKLAAITKELIAAKKEFGKNSVQWLELKAAQAEQIAAIKELENQNKAEASGGKSPAQFFFEQMQKLQGFSSNLLSNIIPLDQTAGLVGGSSIPSSITAVSTAKAAKEQLGSTSGQFNQLLSIEEQALAELKRIANGDSFPEARYQRASNHAMMDVF